MDWIGLETLTPVPNRGDRQTVPPRMKDTGAYHCVQIGSGC